MARRLFQLDNNIIHIPTFKVKRNDEGGKYSFHITDEAGANLDVSSTVIRVNVSHIDSLTAVVSRQTDGILFTGSGDAKTEGKGHYAFQTGDTGFDGTFYFELELTDINGVKITLPSNNEKPALLIITADGDNT